MYKRFRFNFWSELRCGVFVYKMSYITSYWKSESPKGAATDSVGSEQSESPKLMTPLVSESPKGVATDSVGSEQSENPKLKTPLVSEVAGSGQSEKRALSSSLLSPGAASPDAKKLRALSEDIDDAPHWVPLIFKSLDVLHDKMDGFVAFKEDIEKRMTDVEKSVNFLSDGFDTQKADIAVMKDAMKKLQEENTALKSSQIQLFKKVDSNEQHSRNECLLLHGVAEASGETSDQAVGKFLSIAAEKLGVQLEPRDVKRGHRLGKPRTDAKKPRAIIVRFSHPAARRAVFLNKKKMKGTKMTFTENLTDYRLNKLNEARDTHGPRNVWSIEGRLYAKSATGKIQIDL